MYSFFGPPCTVLCIFLSIWLDIIEASHCWIIAAIWYSNAAFYCSPLLVWFHTDREADCLASSRWLPRCSYGWCQCHCYRSHSSSLQTKVTGKFDATTVCCLLWNFKRQESLANAEVSAQQPSWFKVIQGRRFWYQWKAHIRLSISH